MTCMSKKKTKIGAGCFSIAYKRKEDGKIEIHSVDPIKKLMASKGFPKSTILPKIKKIGTKDNKQIYLMDHYTVLENKRQLGLSERQEELYNILCRLGCHYNYNKTIKSLKRIPDKFKKEKELILKCLTYIKDNKIPVAIDIHDGNLAVKNKKLILLDIFYPIKEKMM